MKTIVFLLGIDEAKKLKEQYLKAAINSLDKDNKLVDFLKIYNEKGKLMFIDKKIIIKLKNLKNIIL